MENLNIITQAKALIDSVRGSPQTIEERQAKAIELAALMLREAERIQTPKERKIQKQLAGMMKDPVGKAFTIQLTDQCFRSHDPKRVVKQIRYVIRKFGIPKFLPWYRRAGLKLFDWFGMMFPKVFVPFMRYLLRKETSQVILPGEYTQLVKHMAVRREEGVRLNLNHLGEAVLGEEEALRRLEVYIEDLKRPTIEYISVKISTICSQLNLLSWEDTLNVLSDRLKKLYRTAKQHPYLKKDGSSAAKFVNLDMEEYRDLYLTVAVFKRVLEDPEFKDYQAGIVLQSYLPDSYAMQKDLTAWALDRVAAGGAPIKIRIVKGANLAMEQVEAALRGWPQAPYSNKADVDANFKRMVNFGCLPKNVQVAHLGIASHNLFDIAYAMLIRAENTIEAYTCFEMLEGMADHMRRVVQKLSGDMLLYCPAATKEEFQNAVAYLVRRLDENTAPQNFLRHAFNLLPGTEEWQSQAGLFASACSASSTVSDKPRRSQNRTLLPKRAEFSGKFQNEPDTDWALPQNRRWASDIVEEWSKKKFETIPLQIGGTFIFTELKSSGIDPSRPDQPLYAYSLASKDQIDASIEAAVNAQKEWSQTSAQQRAALMSEIGYEMRLQRANLIGVMIADTGKTVGEADVEVSEAIDFADYYRENILEISMLNDVEWKPKGTVLVVPPWNFPVSIAAGGILAALATGNTVVFKPAPEAVLVGWEVAKLFWTAGVGKDVLQFVTCEDDPVGSRLVRDPRIDTIILTGATSTAKSFLKMRPGLDLMAETGGKNAMIITGLADRDLAIKDLVQSAFGHSGQKCSACSLAICAAEVYDDLHFRKQLRDAAKSLKVGSAWDLSTKLNPLINLPNPTLNKGLTELDEGEEWLLKPEQDAQNPHLWSPGIKLGVKAGSYSHRTEFFGPVLSLMRANDLADAIRIANGTPYGLTSGLHSLDEREHTKWIKEIEAGNCYINRGITGAIVQRQPFGGTKESSFGRGAKAGGPNYLIQLLQAEQVGLPYNQDFPTEKVLKLEKLLQDESEGDRLLWKISTGSYAFFWNHYFNKKHDLSLLQGQDNYLSYRPHKRTVFRIQQEDRLVDILRVVAAVLTVGAAADKFEISSDREIKGLPSDVIKWKIETEAKFIERVKRGEVKRLRLISEPSENLKIALAGAAVNVLRERVMANGRIELLNYLREITLSFDYHRYGNLGEREGETRSPLTPSKDEMTNSGCVASSTCCLGSFSTSSQC